MKVICTNSRYIYLCGEKKLGQMENYPPEGGVENTRIHLEDTHRI